MDGDIAQQIEERLNTLPEAVRGAIISAELSKHVQELAKRHQLHLDQAGALENEVLLAMLGFYPQEEFTQKLRTNVQITADQAQALANDVNEEIFKPAREATLRASNMPRPEIAEEPEPVTMPPLTPSPEPKATPAPVLTTLPITPTTPPAPAPSVTPIAKPIDTHPADELLMQKTVSAAPQIPAATPPATAPSTPVGDPTKPQPYKATDPYREPIE